MADNLINYVKFQRGTPSAYKNLSVKDEDTLYFVSEADSITGVLYLGEKLISSGNNGDIIDEFDEEQRTVNGGIIEGHVYVSDVKDYLDENIITKDGVIDYIQYKLDDEFSIETMFGRGWIHVDLDDPMEFHDIEIKDYYGVTNIFIDTIIINAPEITKTINWFFANKEEIYKEFEDEDLDESVKIKTKKKSITEDLTKADKEDAESKMDKWHEGKRKQNEYINDFEEKIIHFK